MWEKLTFTCIVENISCCRVLVFLCAVWGMLRFRWNEVYIIRIYTSFINCFVFFVVFELLGNRTYPQFRLTNSFVACWFKCIQCILSVAVHSCFFQLPPQVCWELIVKQQYRLVGLWLYLVPLSTLAYHLHEHDIVWPSCILPAKVLLPCWLMPRIIWQFSVTC